MSDSLIFFFLGNSFTEQEYIELYMTQVKYKTVCDFNSFSLKPQDNQIPLSTSL